MANIKLFFVDKQRNRAKAVGPLLSIDRGWGLKKGLKANSTKITDREKTLCLI